MPRRRLTVFIAAFLFLALVVGALGMLPSNADVTAAEKLLTKKTLLRWAHIKAPADGTGVQVHLDFPGEDPAAIGDRLVYSLTADITPSGSLIVRNVVTGGKDDPGLNAGACADPAFLPLGVKWRDGDLPVSWKLNMDSKPKRLTFYATKEAARRAHRTWPDVRTNCDDAQKNGFVFRFKHLTARRIKRDNVNVVDFGSLGGGALASAYTWYTGHRIIETDLRLNSRDYRWTNKPDGKKAYQVVNVVTHELGHTLGLDDLSWPHGGQTMFGRTYKGERKKVTLGRGDIKGARAVSP